jgi:HPt (histidine-containing phosphotransfer) domain-containing protein
MQALGLETEVCTDKHVENLAITADPETTDVLDIRVLAQLAVIQRNGRPGFVERIITLFLQTASDLIKDLEAASANNEPVGLYRASHTLKPCSATLGALSLAALCEALEEMARSGSLQNPEVRVEEIAEEYKRVEAALKGFVCHAD